MKEDLIDRFEISYCVMKNDCWEWQLYCKKNGYGEFKMSNPYRKTWLAHRFAYLIYNGELPQFLDHLCRNRRCVNPRHLEPTTIKNNVLKGIGITAMHARQTHCHRGHIFDKKNTYKVPNGRDCRTCRRAARQKYKIKMKGKLSI